MREGWTYKKLGEVCEIYQPKTLSTEDLVADGDYPVYGANGIIGRFNSYNHEFPEVLLTCRGATCGRINISQPFSWINGNAMVIHRKSDDLSFDFLKYVMFSLDYSLIITGAAQPQITRQKLAPTVISYPPLSEQQSIVAELDKINELISLKKAQLSDLDSLAQSIFYDMFGDPIENEKGWEVKKLGEACLLKAGKSIKASDLVEKKDNTFPCYGGNGIRGYIDRFSHEMDLPIIGRQGALCGNVNFAKGPFYATEHAVVVTPIVNLDVVWLYYVLKGLRLENYAHGVAQPGISVGDLNPIPLPIPPLSLQQEFAKRIELIEQQKAQISSTIKDLETLLASRMQYWFD